MGESILESITRVKKCYRFDRLTLLEKVEAPAFRGLDPRAGQIPR